VLRRLVLAAAVAAALHAPIARAAEYHVATTGSGSACTVGAPCATIAAALALAGPRDTIWIHAGTYLEAITTAGAADINGGSSWPTALIVSAWPGDAVTLRPGATQNGVVFLAETSASWIEFVGLRLDAVNVTGAQAVKVTSGGEGASTHVRFRDGEVFNSPANGVLTSEGGDFVEVVRMAIYANGRHLNLDHGVYFSSDDNLVDDCNIYGNAATGVHVYDGGPSEPDRNTIRNSRVYGNGLAGPTGEGIQTCGTNHLITGNEVFGNGTGAGISVYHEAGVCESANATVTANHVYGNLSAIEIQAGATGTVESANVLAAPFRESMRGGTAVTSGSVR